MSFTFECERCGKVCHSESDPSNWKQRLCYDCRKGTKSNSSGYQQQSKAQNVQRYEVSKPVFSTENYIDGLLDAYEILKFKIQERDLNNVPEESIASWATSVMIQQDRNK